MIDALRKAYRRNREFVLYCLIGLSGVTADFLVFLALTQVGIDPLVATFISVSCGIINNFVWNAWLNFKVRSHLLIRFLSFYAVGLVGVALSIGILWVGSLLGLTPAVAKIISIPIVVVVQFVLNRVVTFRKTADRTYDPALSGEIE